VITNQPDVARGQISRETIEDIHSYLGRELPIDDILACCHDDADHCECRKPLPGLIFQAAQKHGIDIAASYVIGDRWRDIDAGAAAGCRTVLIDHSYSERSPSTSADICVSSLSDAVDRILEELRSTELFVQI
jgi:D-glycero-D-manno-heptose 1,7-bisphosphate phosphatase